MTPLEYTIEEHEDGTWSVWMPDCNDIGEIIGEGKSKREAMENAALNLRDTAAKILEEME